MAFTAGFQWICSGGTSVKEVGLKKEALHRWDRFSKDNQRGTLLPEDGVLLIVVACTLLALFGLLAGCGREQGHQRGNVWCCDVFMIIGTAEDQEACSFINADSLGAA